MAEPYLAEIRAFSFNSPPSGWARCDGQLLPINQNQALFALLGTTYGGDGATTFALPDLRGRVPLHRGDGLVIGKRAGASIHKLHPPEMPSHTHGVIADDTAPAADGQNPVPSRRLSRSQPGNLYGPASALAAMSPSAVTSAGGGGSHNNMQPYLTICFCIALQGVFPSRN